MPADAEYLAELNLQQREAVLYSGRPLLILAGAGSGKTRVITVKIAYLVDGKGFDPSSILGVAFTNKAAEEMRGRVRALVPGAAEVMIRTFHSFGAWVLRRYSSRIGLNPDFTIYDEQDAFGFLSRLLEKKTAEGRLREIARGIERLKDAGVSPEAYLEGRLPADRSCRLAAGDQQLGEAYRLYQDRLQECGCLDFGDLILMAVRLLRERPEVRASLQERFRAVLVDEYQDSNAAQFQLLSEIHDQANELCVVGDEDQSIYSFRGADIENILHFQEAFPGTVVIRLEENYRSTRNILEVASRVVARNTHRLGKTLWTRKEEGVPVGLARLVDQEAEARFCAELLRDRSYGDTAILYRMNFQSRVFETCFSRLGIPFRVVGTARFYEREEVKDVLAYLALLVNPRDEVAFLRAAQKPRRGIGEATLRRVLEVRAAGALDLLEASSRCLEKLSRRAASDLASFLGLLKGLKDHVASGSVGGLIRSILEQTGLYVLYRERDELESSQRALNLEELVSAAADYGNGLIEVARFLENAGLGSLEANPFDPEGQVTLITVHNTKGLEFDRVILTGLEEGIFPHHASLESEELEEERRLFYVAATRARQTLILTSCQRRRLFGSFKVLEPSRFLGEIPGELLQVFGSAGEADDGFSPGTTVFHEEYGGGVITRKWSQDGIVQVMVRFDSGRLARFVLKYSGLERIDRDP